MSDKASVEQRILQLFTSLTHCSLPCCQTSNHRSPTSYAWRHC